MIGLGSDKNYTPHHPNHPPPPPPPHDLSTRIHQREMDSDVRKDIVVNHVHPGYVDTELTRSKSLLQCKTK